MKTIIRQIAGSILAAAVSVMFAACTIDGINFRGTGSGGQADGQAHVEPCKIVGGSTIDTSVVECRVGLDLPTFTGPAGLLTEIVVNAMYDPLILELPASASGPTGFITVDYRGFPISGSLQITAGLTSIPIDAKTTLVAEPGKQLVILDVPSGFSPSAGSSVTFNLHYVDLTHSPIKAIFAAKVPVGGTTYYPPLVPCVTDFASVPAVSLGGLSITQLATLLAGMTPCNHKAYDFGGGAPPPPAAANYQGLWWNPAESYWGVNFAHQGDQVFATWYTYDTSGNAYWLSMLAGRTTSTSNVYGGDINVDVGPPFNNLVGSGSPTKVGTGSITFSDANNASFAYNLDMGVGGSAVSVSQAKAITRFSLGGAQPTCTYAAAPNLAAATNYQDLWWDPTENGRGINFAHQGSQLFATWYTYDEKSAGNNPPLWLSALMTQGTGNVFTGPLTRTSGPRFDNYKASDVVQPIPTVGTAAVTFIDGNHASFHYTTNGSGGLQPLDQTISITRFLFATTGATTCQ